MREIKFRSWGNGVGMRGPFSLTDSAIYKSDPLSQLEWMQYTGLKDKNGKEIYEGDIVRHEWFRGDVQTTIVAWTANGACFTYAGTRYDFEGLLYPNEWEVIGNTHENPELIPKGGE